MKLESTLSVVVLPEPVPPQIRIVQRARTARARKSASGAVSVPLAIRSSALKPRRRKRRIVSTGPSSASGGITTFTREPSGRRASHERLRLVDAAPQRREDPLDRVAQLGLDAEARAEVCSSRPWRSTHAAAQPHTITSSTSGSASRGSSGPSPKERSAMMSTSAARALSSSTPASRSTSARMRACASTSGPSSPAPASSRSRSEPASPSRAAVRVAGSTSGSSRDVATERPVAGAEGDGIGAMLVHCRGAAGGIGAPIWCNVAGGSYARGRAWSPSARPGRAPGARSPAAWRRCAEGSRRHRRRGRRPDLTPSTSTSSSATWAAPRSGIASTSMRAPGPTSSGGASPATSTARSPRRTGATALTASRSICPAPT